MKAIIKHFKSAATAFTALMLAGCSNFIELDPPKTQIVSSTVFSDDRTAISAISGIYAAMITSGSFASGGSGSITIQTGLSSDEYQNLSSAAASLQFSNNALIPTNSTVSSIWSSLYQIIFYSNSMLEGLSQPNSITAPVKLQLEGEALFIRAFAHFYLANLYGDIPVVTSTDYRINSTATRDSIDKVYMQIIADLNRAAEIMNEDYEHAAGERVRPNKYAALSLLARIYLYQEQWELAAVTSTKVIEAISLYQLEDDLNSVFLMNSMEAIWQLMPILPQANTNEGSAFRSLSFAAVSASLNNSFQTTDQRYQQWTTIRTVGARSFRIPFKYKIGVSGQPRSEYSMVIRLAELYLIRAEARAQLSQLEDALSDLNTIRVRAGAAVKNLSSQSALLIDIAQERRVELFSEWGHRWFDLKRTKTIDQTLSPLKPDWQPQDALYPLPKSDRDNNPNLSQNQGY